MRLQSIPATAIVLTASILPKKGVWKSSIDDQDFSVEEIFKKVMQQVEIDNFLSSETCVAIKNDAEAGKDFVKENYEAYLEHIFSRQLSTLAINQLIHRPDLIVPKGNQQFSIVDSDSKEAEVAIAHQGRLG